MTVASEPVAGQLDSRLFKPDAIDPETNAFNAELASKLAGLPPVWSIPVQVTRQAREEGRGPFGPLVLSNMAVNRDIPGPSGPIAVRTFVPQTVTGVYLHLHGGGWTLGRAHHFDPLLESIANGAQVAVVSVDYRLAPEHPYPAGPDDCEAAALWLVAHAESEFRTNRLMIGGESAGGHLSAVTLVRLRDKHHLRSFVKANLVYGCYDLGMTPSMRKAPDDTLILPAKATEWFVKQFGIAGKESDPDVSPLRAELHDLPPALFTIGTMDPLLDDSLFMYGRWLAAGNEAELAIYPGGIHGFTSLPFKLAKQANQRAIDFLKQ